MRDGAVTAPMFTHTFRRQRLFDWSSTSVSWIAPHFGGLTVCGVCVCRKVGVKVGKAAVCYGFRGK